MGGVSLYIAGWKVRLFGYAKQRHYASSNAHRTKQVDMDRLPAKTLLMAMFCNS